MEALNSSKDETLSQVPMVNDGGRAAKAELRFEEPFSDRLFGEHDTIQNPVLSRRRSKSQGHILPGRSLYEYDPFDLKLSVTELGPRQEHEQENTANNGLEEEKTRRGMSKSFHVFDSEKGERAGSPLLTHLNARKRCNSGYENPPSTISFSEPRTQEKSFTKEDWTCLSCGNSNYSWRHVCNMRKCRAPKPGHLLHPSPPGSWTCTVCGNLNYAERTVCNMRKCRASRVSQSHLQMLTLNPYNQLISENPYHSPSYNTQVHSPATDIHANPFYVDNRYIFSGSRFAK